MQLLDKLQYLGLMGPVPGTVVSPTSQTVDRVFAYATTVFPNLQLKHRKLKTDDLASVFQHGEHTFFHVKAFPRTMKDTFVVVVAKDTTFVGHILIDLAAEYSQPYLNCPSFDFSDAPDAKDIERMIPQIRPDHSDPFAILSLADGTFMQTLRTEDGFVLEHQLVNTSSHYEIPKLATSHQVVKAMVAYAFGNDEEWLRAFAWQRQLRE